MQSCQGLRSDSIEITVYLLYSGVGGARVSSETVFRSVSGRVVAAAWTAWHRCAHIMAYDRIAYGIMIVAAYRVV